MKKTIDTNTQILEMPKLKKEKKNFKKKAIIFIVILLITVFIGGTYAFYFSGTSILNKFKTMTYDVKLEEEFNGTFGTKKVRIINNESDAPVVLRINYLEIWSKEDEEGAYDTLSNKFDNIEVVTKGWTQEFKENFTLRDDGWYYYNKVLNPGNTIEILENITLNDELIQGSVNYEDYKTYNYELTFNYEAIQATKEAIGEIWGLYVDIDQSGNISWEV